MKVCGAGWPGMNLDTKKILRSGKENAKGLQEIIAEEGIYCLPGSVR